jgi:TPR repeat protein
VNKRINRRKAQELFETGLQRAFLNNTDIIARKKNKSFEDEISSALLALSELLMETDSNEISTEIYEAAFTSLVRAADRGNSDAQHRLAGIYATGVSLGGQRLLPMDPGRSLVLEYMSALGGNLPAMTVRIKNFFFDLYRWDINNIDFIKAMGYRYLHGVGVTESCDIALPFYEYAANAAFEYVSKLGYPQYQDRTLISSLAENSLLNSLVELTGLSNYLKRFNLNLEFFRGGWLGRGGGRKGGRQEINEEWADYYAHLAESGDAGAASALGTIYTYGSRLIAPNLQKAKHFLSIGANAKNSGQHLR